MLISPSNTIMRGPTYNRDHGFGSFPVIKILKAIRKQKIKKIIEKI
jgi:hypothetical protein